MQSTRSSPSTISENSSSSRLAACAVLRASSGVAWGLPVWAESYGQLDAGVSYKLLNDQLSLGLEAQNLNSARQRQLMQQHVGYMTRGLFYTGPRYVVTARYTF